MQHIAADLVVLDVANQGLLRSSIRLFVLNQDDGVLSAFAQDELQIMGIRLKGLSGLIVAVDHPGQLALQAAHMAHRPLALLLAGLDFERDLLARLDL